MRAFTSTVETASTLPMAVISSGTSAVTAATARTAVAGGAALVVAAVSRAQDTVAMATAIARAKGNGKRLGTGRSD